MVHLLIKVGRITFCVGLNNTNKSRISYII
jgi:hypothetical protein